ncbi:hypothetical protein BKA67DRAFT_585434 [Truncatella angustata]|uniref:Uncharacterized protein n=1 Tax=Truncatella angustata TaxID=152316 RepID=A0A9P8RGS8_9PEZI|nr:uncharacterized protein BKA67DRAFT_585434 [Truncatella angustata]KAH6645552.1 hypothetical protein BKA67DRAFT_585434 [Truncatella angustata]
MDIHNQKHCEDEYDALTTDQFEFPIRSTQGFLTVTISRHITEGKLQELWRFHVLQIYHLT